MEQQKNMDGSPRKKPGPKPRQTSNMHAAGAALTNQHRDDDHSDHGRTMPQRGEERIPVGQQRRLGNIEGFIGKECVGHWVLEINVQNYAQGGYEQVKDQDNNPIFRVGRDEKLFLMQIPRKYWKEDQQAKIRQAIDMMGESATIDPRKGEYDPTNPLNSGKPGYSVKTEDHHRIDPEGYHHPDPLA